MGRPTNEKKEKTVKLRLSEELYDEVVRQGDNISETIREYIREGVGVKKHGEIPEGDYVPQKVVDDLKTALLGRCKGEAEEFVGRNMWECITIIPNNEYEENREKGEIVPQNPLDMPVEEYKDLKNMCEVSGLTIGKFMGYVYRLFSDGKIYIDGLAVKTRGSCNLSPLEDVCHRVNADPQDMIDKLVKSLLRG